MRFHLARGSKVEEDIDTILSEFKLQEQQQSQSQQTKNDINNGTNNQQNQNQKQQTKQQKQQTKQQQQLAQVILKLRYNITPRDLDIDSAVRDMFGGDNNIAAAVLGGLENNNNNNNAMNNSNNNNGMRRIRGGGRGRGRGGCNNGTNRFLSFNDEPNYKFIESCLREFTIRTEITETDEIPPINWEGGVSSIQSSSRKRDRDQNAIKSNNISSSKEETNQDLFVKKGLVQFYPHDLHNKDPLLESVLVDAERERARKDVIDGKDSNNSGGNNTGSGGGVSSDLTRLPLTLAYRLAQVEYNTANPDTVPPYLAFRDWFALAAELRCMYFTWDSKKYEIGTKRTNNDKYKRELYAKLLEYCVNVGEAYKGFNMKGMLDSQRLGVIWFNEDGNKHAYDEDINNDKFIENGIKNEDSDKSSCNNEFRDNNIMTVFALVKVTLNIILVKEIAKEIAPPPELTFGVSSMKRET